MAKAPDKDELFQDVLKDEKAANKPAKPEAPVMQRADPRAPRPEPTELIFIVDDSPTVLTIVAALLRRQHFATMTFRTAELALDAFETLGDELTKLRAVYSDVSMPGMGGLALLKTIREAPDFLQLPFVLISSNVDRELIIEAAMHKVNGFLVKPITEPQLASSIEGLFPGRTLLTTPRRAA